MRLVLALLPLLAIRAIVRVLRDQDELEGHIELEAFAVVAMAIGFGSFSLGHLGDAMPVRDVRHRQVARRLALSQP